MVGATGLVSIPSPMGGGAITRILGAFPPQQSTLMALFTSRAMPSPMQAELA